MIQYCFTRHYAFRYTFSSPAVECSLYRFHNKFRVRQVQGFSYSGDWLPPTEIAHTFWMYLDRNSGIPKNPESFNRDSAPPVIALDRAQAVHNIKSSHPGSLDVKLWSF